MPIRLNDGFLENQIERYKDMVYGIAVLRMKQRSDADDIFQEVFVKYVKHAARLKEKGTEKQWLIRVTINLCNDHYRSGWFRRTVSYDDGTQKGEYGDNDNGFMPDEHGESESVYYGFLDRIVEEEERNTLFEAVKKLPPKYGDVIFLHYYEETMIRDIAKILEIGEGAVKTRLMRGREMLKKALGRENGEQ